MSIHFVGIGGIGMSGAARILLSRGERVTGTDLRDSEVLEMLRQRGASISVGRRARRVPSETSRLVYTAAASPEHPELMDAQGRGIPTLRYAQLLGELMEGRKGVAVAGMHGKTTTTAMVALILREAGLDPAAVVGGLVPEFPGNALEGNGEPFVAEACEYTRSFLALQPLAAIITNIEPEHLDYYRDEADIVAAFRDFAARIRSDGVLVTTEAVKSVLGGATKPGVTVVTVGGPEADVIQQRGEEPDPASKGRNAFTLRLRGGAPQLFDLAVPGLHNVLNAAMASVLVRQAFGIPLYVSARVLSRFRGVGRRFENVFDSDRAAIYDDYGHHPTEIRATVAGAREASPGRRLLLVFQPHQRSRTKHLFGDFVDALALADRVYLPPTYRVAGREVEAGPDSDALAEALVERGAAATYVSDFGACVNRLVDDLEQGDLVLTMGAGDVNKVAHELARRLR